MPVCAPAAFHGFADQLKGTRARLEVTDRRFCATRKRTVVGNRPKRAPLFSLRLRTRIEHNEAAKGRAPSTQGINIARFLSLVVPPVSFQDLGNSYRQSRVISSIFSNVLEIFFFFFLVLGFSLLYTQLVNLDWMFRMGCFRIYYCLI